MKKFFRRFKNIYLDLLIIFLASAIFLYAVLLHINVFTLKYMIPVALFLIVCCIFNSFIVVSKKVKNKFKIFFSILFTILTVIFITIGVILLNLFSSVQDMFSNESFVEYSVIVNKDSNYKELDDLDADGDNKKIIGYYQEDTYHNKAEKKLSKEIDINYIGYSTIEELEYSLLVNDIDAIMIIDSYLDVLKDNNLVDEETENTEEVNETTNTLVLDKIKDFDEKTKTIYTFKIKVDSEENEKSIDLEQGSFAIYVSGQDSYADSVSDASRSDVNLLMVANVKTKQILLVSIPRDYYVSISGRGAYDKLTHISIYGSQTTANTIGELLDVNVDYFVKFNFTTFMRAIEYMLPLDVYSDYDFTTGVYDQTIGNTYTFSKGYNHITSGEMALQFVRARKNFSEGDRQRGINQSRMLRAVINKATTPQVLIRYNDILSSLNGTFLTNISDESIIEIIKYMLNNNGKFNITSFSLDGYDASRPTYSGGSQPLYVMIPNYDTVGQAKVYIKDVLEGRVPNIDTDASELIDSSNSATVGKGVYKETYYPVYNNNKNNNTNNNKVENKTEEKEEIKEEENNNTEETNQETSNEEENNNTEDNNSNDNENTGDNGDGNDVVPEPSTPEIEEENSN